MGICGNQPARASPPAHGCTRCPRPAAWLCREAQEPQHKPVVDEFTFKPLVDPKSRRMVEASYPRDRDQRIEQLSQPKNLAMRKYDKVSYSCSM